jgi:uncharacterized protein (TIGR04551 family)
VIGVWRLVVFLFVASVARADDAPDEAPLQPPLMTPSPWKELRVRLDGYLRVRAGVWNDLDLSRGPSPSTGEPIFPTPAAGGDHTLAAMDMRMRLEPTIEVGQAVRIHARFDLLDNIGFGSTPDVLPSTTNFAFASRSAEPPSSGWNALRDSMRVKRAWGEVTLPFGVLSAGRMGAQVNWGTGFFVNNGDCISCDFGDAGDRIALSVPLFGHWITALYELSASGPQVVPTGAGSSRQPIDVERRAHVHSAALTFARFDSPEAQRRRLRAGRTLVQYGLLASYRRQELDAPGWTQPGGFARTFGPNDFVRRDLQSFAADLWLLVHRGGFRAELEAATVIGRIGDASNTPGVALRAPVTSTQWGGVASLSYTLARFPLRLRAEVGVASGDDAPGFGVRVAPGQLTAQKGDHDGPQLRPPADQTLDNFRFHPDYRVDLILWRRIVGQVTDAVYVKPSLRLGPFGPGNHQITFDASLIDSHALFATTPPGQDKNLGVEIDLAARYRYEPAFEVAVTYGLFAPLDGFRNVELSLDAKPAQALEIILMYRI